MTEVKHTTYAAARQRTTAHVAFPAELNAGPNAYAVNTVGDCLRPAYSHGDLIVCDPDVKPVPGDYVAIWWKDGRQPMVKRLMMGLPPKDCWSLTGFDWLLCCEQHNPPQNYEFSGQEVEAVHKVLGKARQLHPNRSPTSDEEADTARQVGIIFDEMASLAANTERLLIQAVTEADTPQGFASDFIVAARTLVTQIGWLADLGGGKIDGSGLPSVKGGPEDWMLPPSYHDASETAQS